MTGRERENPFQGPRPYGREDREWFLGREEVGERLLTHVYTAAATTLFGESGAGKSSLMQARVLPLLEERHGFRTVCVDRWPEDHEPLDWLAVEVAVALGLGEATEGSSGVERLEAVLEVAEQRSERPVLLYLDQFEQHLQPGRDASRTARLFEGLEKLVRRRSQVQLVLGMREDYLGRFRDRARGLRGLLENGFRLKPLAVGEMARVVRELAARGGHEWSEGEVRALMGEVRVPGERDTDDAEVQAAYAQIVCRARWEQRAPGEVKAGRILQGYLEQTLEGMGPRKEECWFSRTSTTAHPCSFAIASGPFPTFDGSGARA